MTDEHLEAKQREIRRRAGLVELPCRDCGRLTWQEPHTGTEPVCGPCKRQAEQRERQARHEKIENARVALEQSRREEAERQRQAYLRAVRADIGTYQSHCGVARRWQGWTFDKCTAIPAKILTAAKRWAEDPDGLFVLMGPPGCGKTSLSVAVLAHLLCEGLATSNCKYLPESEFLAACRECKNGPSEFGRFQFLIFDDLGSSRLTDWGAATVAELIARRHGHKTPTAISTNLSLEELAVAVDSRTVSRLVEDRNVFSFGSKAEDLRVGR